MSQVNLLFIGAILSVTLGCLALRLVRKNDNLEWNEAIAAYLICLMFIGKGLQNAAGGYAEEAGSDSIWQFWVSLNFNLDYFFFHFVFCVSPLVK